jgi:hypothetical protein
MNWPLENSPLQIIRGVLPVFGVALIGIALGMTAVVVQLDPTPASLCIAESNVCSAISYANWWLPRLVVYGGVMIGIGIFLESYLN